MKNCQLLIVTLFFAGVSFAQGIDPVSLIISKAIKAIDLKVQKLQNETIWLQQAQSLAENELSKLKLSEINGWQRQLSDLYAGYFAELQQVKGAVTGLAQIRRIVVMQKRVVFEYGRMAKDANVKPQYDALLNTSMDVLQTLYAVSSSQYAMRDAERISMILSLKDAMSHCLSSIQALNQQQVDAIAAHARMQADLQFVKKLNGIQ
jgi:hypothetical protein